VWSTRKSQNVFLWKQFEAEESRMPCKSPNRRCRNALRQRRQKLGVSGEELADMCGLDRTYICGIERGERNAALVNIEKIAKTLKLSVSELFRKV